MFVIWNLRNRLLFQWSSFYLSLILSFWGHLLLNCPGLLLSNRPGFPEVGEPLKNVLQFLLISARDRIPCNLVPKYRVHLAVHLGAGGMLVMCSRAEQLYLEATLWAVKVTRWIKHFPQHMKLHHCSYISMSFLQHILSVIFVQPGILIGLQEVILCLCSVISCHDTVSHWNHELTIK